MLVRGEEVCVFATKIDRLLQEGHHGRKVIRGPGSFPSVIGRSTERAGARHVIGGHLYRLLEIASRDTYKARFLGLVGQTGGVWLKFLKQVAELGGDRFFMGQSANNRVLPSPCSGSEFWQVGSLIPGKQGTCCPQVADLQQAPRQFRKLNFGRLRLMLCVVHSVTDVGLFPATNENNSGNEQFETGLGKTIGGVYGARHKRQRIDSTHRMAELRDA